MKKYENKVYILKVKGEFCGKRKKKGITRSVYLKEMRHNE
jgi:hypothetical protein